MWRKIFFDTFASRLLSRRNGLFDIYQFGVLTGNSMKSIWHGLSPYINLTDRFFAFDSFCGFPEDDAEPVSQDWTKGNLNTVEYHKQNSVEETILFLKKELGKSIDIPLIFIPGFFNVSLNTQLCRSYEMKQALYVDIDVDLYSSTKTVLDFLVQNDIIGYGTIIGYDDWGGTPGWEDMADGESRAHREMCETYGLEFQELIQFGRQFPHVHKVFMCLGKV